MTTHVFTGDFRHDPLWTAPLRAVREAWLNHRQRRENRLALARIGRLDPRLQADMGFDPEGVGAALGGGWDDLRPNGLLLRRRR
jgi:hypothetical protein